MFHFSDTHKNHCTRFALLTLWLLASQAALGQLVVDWSNTYGGGGFESMYAAFETPDGGFMLGANAGFSTISGNISNPSCGSSDFWLIKTDANGNITWDNSFGGNDQELTFSTILTADGGYASTGQTQSLPSCDVLTPSFGFNDCWVIKTDANGNLQWRTRVGSSAQEYTSSIIQTADGGYLVGGLTPSSFDNPNAGNDDYWIIKLDAAGTVTWNRTIGGSGFDHLEAVRQMPDGGYVLGGRSTSGISGVKSTPNYGSNDMWLVKVDANGIYQWDRNFGGNQEDQILDMEVTPDGGLILAGFSDSGISGNKTSGNNGGRDMWIVKTDANGNKLWENNFGGNNYDDCQAIDVVDNGCAVQYLLIGSTLTSANGDVSGANNGSFDYWLVMTDANGNLVWENNYGGVSNDIGIDFQKNSDDSYIVAGYTSSDNSGDVPPNFGQNDNWVFKLSCDFDIPNIPNETICEGASVTLTAPPPSCPGCTYQWSSNAGNSTNKNISVNPTSTTTYTVTVTNVTCCTDTASVTVFVEPVPTVDLGNDFELCPGDTVTLDASNSGCSYLWNTGSTNSNIEITSIGNYSVTVTCVGGCTATDEVVVTAGSAPPVNLGNDIFLCPGDSFTLDAGPGNTYIWSPNGETTPTISGNSEGNYGVTVTQNNGCTAMGNIQITEVQNDTTIIPNTVCLAAQNMMDTLFLQNQFGCDSLVISENNLIPPDTVITQQYTCDTLLAGVDTLFVAGALGTNACDSVFIQNIIFAPSDTIHIDTSTCINAQAGLDTLFLQNQFGCDSLVIFDYQLIEADTFIFQNFTCDQNLATADTTLANGMNGECDSVLINLVNFIPPDTIHIDTSTCINAQAGLDTLFLQNQFGCDSLVVFDYQLIQADTFIFQNFTCNENLATADTTLANGMNGECDSVLINLVNFIPADTIHIDTSTCINAQAGLDTLFLQNQFGCDSLVVFDYQLIQADTFIFQNFTCDQNLATADTTLANGMNGECDSVLVQLVNFVPPDTIHIDTSTCLTAQAGLDTLFLQNQFGCDSLVVFDYQLIQADTFIFQNFTCDQNLATADTTLANGMNGECDSVLINLVNFIPPDTIHIDTSTCLTAQAGLDTLFLQNQFGCDSLVVFDYQLIQADTFIFQNFTCDQNLATADTTLANGMNGECDSVLINLVNFIPADTIHIDTSTCINAQAGLDTLFLQNQFGCDSLVVFDYQLIQADTFIFQNFTCDQNLATADTTLANGMNGECDSVLINLVNFIPADTIHIDTSTCLTAQAGLDTLFLQNQFGCDSLVIFDYQLIEADTFIFQNFTCDQNLATADTTLANGMNGECDSVLIQLVNFIPADTNMLVINTCDPNAVGLDTLHLQNQFGCDSIVFTNTILVTNDTIVTVDYTCEINQVSSDTLTLQGINGECDTIFIAHIFSGITPPNFIDTTTCDPLMAGLDTIFNINQFGCDSLEILNFVLLPSETITINQATCDANQTGTITQILPGMNGECDTTLIVNTLLNCDTIFINLMSCNPLDTGVVTLVNGDSTFITTTNLAPTDTIFLFENSCNPLDTGWLATPLTNQFGCDSIVFIYTNLLPSQDVQIHATTCDSTLAGTMTNTFQNQFGCDSMVTTTTVLLESNLDSIMLLSCFEDEVGVDTIFSGQNIQGCDSVILEVTQLEPQMQLAVSYNDITCFGSEDGIIFIDSVIGGTPPYLYSIDYQPFSNNSIFSNLAEGEYHVIVEDAAGCQTFEVLWINPVAEISVDLGEDIFIDFGDSAMVIAQINFSENELDTVIWSPEEMVNCFGNCLQFTAAPQNTMTYSIMVMDENGCLSEDQITIYVDHRVPVYIPNAFSPNGDQLNDRLTIFSNEDVEEIQLFKIFDRWGELVFEEKNFQPNDPSYGWDGYLDGEPLNPAVFVYFAKVLFKDGRVATFEGDITLTR